MKVVLVGIDVMVSVEDKELVALKLLSGVVTLEKLARTGPSLTGVGEAPSARLQVSIDHLSLLDLRVRCAALSE